MLDKSSAASRESLLSRVVGNSMVVNDLMVRLLMIEVVQGKVVTEEGEG